MQFSIPADHPALPGHFPGKPVVPGVLILDRVLDAIQAQYGATQLLRLPQVKFLQPLLPEQSASVELQGDAPRWRFRVQRDADAVLIASGEAVMDEALMHDVSIKRIGA